MFLYEYGAFLLLFILAALWINSSLPDENVFAKKLLSKFFLYVESIMFMILSTDNKGLGPKKNPDPDLMKDDPCTTKRIVFIRHGESDWNSVFNKGFGPSFIGRLFGAMSRELNIYPSRDSGAHISYNLFYNLQTTLMVIFCLSVYFLYVCHTVFIDSPLNMEGIEQARKLRGYIEGENLSFTEQKEYLDILKGDKTNSSVIVSSNLRRAISTVVLSLWPRLQRTKEKILILSSLQEFSRNVDTRALAEAKKIPDLTRISDVLADEGFKFDASSVLDPEFNNGNKTMSFYGIKRLQAFNAWVFSRPEDTIIVGGHSLWFRSYFQTYLPHSNQSLPCCKKKIVNSGVVAFSLAQSNDKNSEGNYMYRIDPDSVTTVTGGYA